LLPQDRPTASNARYCCTFLIVISGRRFRKLLPLAIASHPLGRRQRALAARLLVGIRGGRQALILLISKFRGIL
jgi:hypothetical protein